MGRWDHQLGGPPDIPCACWDCAVLSDIGSGPGCHPGCVACNYPDATIEDCAPCGAMTWHDAGECLRKEHHDDSEA